MENKVKVSVIIPVYNVEPFIRHCLDSLINQTLKEIEIILINDFSTDDSGLICDEFAEKDPRVVAIHNKRNLKQALSRNRGIELAKGEYVGFVDPDDWVEQDYYEKLYKKAKKGDYDIVKAESIMTYPDGIRKKQNRLNKKIKKGLLNDMTIFQLFTSEHCTAIYKRQILIQNNIRYPDIRSGEDLIFLLYVTYFSKSIALISHAYYYYRQHQQSIVAIKDEQYFESILKYFQLQLEFINSMTLEKDQYDYMFLRAFNVVKNHYKELLLSPQWIEFRNEYTSQAFDLLLSYKYDKEFLFNVFTPEFTFQQWKEKFKKMAINFMFDFIQWIPVNFFRRQSKKR